MRARKKSRIAVVLIVVFFLIPLLVFFIGPVSLHFYDAGHVRTVVCTVDSARTGGQSARSLKGVGSSGNQVVIETSDCGKLLLQKGINGQNADGVADELDAGGMWRAGGIFSGCSHPAVVPRRQAQRACNRSDVTYCFGGSGASLSEAELVEMWGQ